MRNCISLILTLVVLGCKASDKPDIDKLSQIKTNVNFLKHYYPDSLHLDLVSQRSLIDGNYSLNTGFSMRYLYLDSTSRYEASEWTDTSGKSQEVAGEWKMNDATIYLINRNSYEAFDVIRCQGSILLIPVDERDKFATLLRDAFMYGDMQERKDYMASREEVVGNKWSKLLERNRIFIKIK